MKYSHKFLKEVINNLITNHPFFASRLIVIEHLLDNSIETACTNGIYIKYNHNFFQSLTYQQRITLVAHELCHIIFMHHLRMLGRDHELWNVATDYAINILLSEMGFEPIPKWLFKPKYSGWSAENIYSDLEGQSQDQQDQQKDQQKGSGGSVEPQAGMSKEETAKALEEGKKELEKAIQQVQAKVNGIEKSKSLNETEKKERIEQAGKGMKQFTSQLTEVRQSQIDWKPIVNRFLNDLQSNDFNMMQPDEDFLTTSEFFMPSIESMEFGNVALALDVSGSLSHMSKQLASEVFHCLNLLGKKTLDVMYVSDYVHDIKTIEHSDDIKIVQGYGTDFKGLFNIVLPNRSESYAGMIFITDGHVDVRDWVEPDYPVLWVLTRKNEYFERTVPFGECVPMI